MFHLLAQAAPALTRTTFEWGRIQSPTDWIVPLVVCAALLAYVALMYRRDSAELHPAVGILLTVLRMAVFVALLLVYMQPQWRNERDQVFNSRVLLLADTSLSMGLHDHDASPVPAEPSRAQQVAAALADGRLLRELRRKHDVAIARFDQATERLASLDKLRPESAPGLRAHAGAAAQAAPQPARKTEPAIDWQAALAPQGGETRLGAALRQLIGDERTAPVAGIVVFTDGRHNSGIDPAMAVELAREARIPIYPVGIGSLKQPAGVRVNDFVAPARAYPGDRYTATGYLQAYGLEGQTVSVELLSRSANDGLAGAAAGERIESTQQVVLGVDGEVVPVKFELTSTEPDRRTLVLRAGAPAQDRNAADNQQEVDIEIVDRQTRVLLFAGGPSREYQFLRNQLRRDKDVVVDVLLQTGSAGISQDANQILDAFPATREALFAYDCLVAFDPDWRVLSSDQAQALEDWVGDQAGGLIAVAGPIQTDGWSQDPALGRIRALYPVEFNRRFTLFADGRYGSQEPWPVEFTRDGLEAEFLWIDETAAASAAAWGDFPGVYGYYSVRGPKPGATVYASFSDPQAASGEVKPPYFVGQFFGSGRVFFLGSGEMWRLRAGDDAYFERFYTKLIRHVSQGRLLRGSNRGVLLVERDRYLLGNLVEVRAQLTNARLEPLELAEVPLEVTLPDSTLLTLTMTADPARAGHYRGQFSVRGEGVYRLDLAVPEATEEQLTRRIQVKVPDIEREDPRRNDALLSDLAEKTGGVYYVGLEAALGQRQGIEPLWARLRDQSRTVTQAAIPTRLWDNQWTMYLLCGLLCLEWLVRRLAKLA